MLSVSCEATHFASAVEENPVPTVIPFLSRKKIGQIVFLEVLVKPQVRNE